MMVLEFYTMVASQKGRCVKTEIRVKHVKYNSTEEFTFGPGNTWK